MFQCIQETDLKFELENFQMSQSKIAVIKFSYAVLKIDLALLEVKI